MPELPEVESVCRMMRRVLGGKKIVSATVADDEIVNSGTPAEAIRSALEGHVVTGVGRKGKYWWIELDERPWLFGHLGMSGWVRELGKSSQRLHSHGKAPMDDEDGNPRFLKLLIEAEDGSRVAFTDGRRLGRLWLADGPEVDTRVKRLGFDVYEALPSVEELAKILGKRKAPIKAVLLDQGVFAGVGNYLADEMLYQAKIAPKRLSSSLTPEEVKALHTVTRQILKDAVEVDADKDKFPKNWLFHHRWGGEKGAEAIGGRAIVREQVAGRTTAWVPEIQR
ncbi:Fpg/Nei family DNA glycosylase [Fimbriimonas ginsengisoli]|uniref:Formamidopyrimidine-DNA glycosylase n=1 Tax=Fimbriimonas ginsengisoli Gsoil 348 TaxID=661478 RepID=A0A068NXJ7_FIMGI|nr:DNA-formamidopyrimidine glycosylase family protein [Fimbriimonas ginsengisoli]AIE87485.1 Formamidopyrimidine-DNA glycosylase [Fimbriimonas ginsengisoli Gsoil 348]